MVKDPTMSAAIHDAEIMMQCSQNDSKQITLLDLIYRL